MRPTALLGAAPHDLLVAVNMPNVAFANVASFVVYVKSFGQGAVCTTATVVEYPEMYRSLPKPWNILPIPGNGIK